MVADQIWSLTDMKYTSDTVRNNEAELDKALEVLRYQGRITRTMLCIKFVIFILT